MIALKYTNCIIILICSVYTLFGQSTFNKLYKDNNHSDYGWSIYRTSDNGYLIGSGTLCGFTSGCDRFIRIDSVGNEIWSKIYLGEELRPSSNGQQSFIEFNDHYLSYGSQQNGDVVETYLREIDPNSAEEIRVVWPPWRYEQISRQLVVTDSNELVAVGLSVSSISQSRVGITVTRLDEDFTILSETNLFNDTFSYRLHTVDLIGEDHVLIAAARVYGGFEDDCLEIIWLDGEGNILWSKVLYCPTRARLEEPGAYYNEDTGLIIYQKNEYIRDLIWEGIDPNPIQMHWIDTTGRLHYSDTIFIPRNTGDDYYNHMVELDNGDVIGIGSGVVPDSLEPEKEGAALVDCFSPHGVHKWRRYVRPELSTIKYPTVQFLDAVSAPDGGIVITGESEDTLLVNGNIVSPTHTWVAKLDSMGCFTPGCDESLIILDIPEVQTKLSEIKQKYISVQPNPILSSNDPLRINVLSPTYIKDAWVSIHNAEGKLIDRWLLENNKTSYDMSMAGHPTGLYIVQYGRAGRILQAEKIIVH